MFITNTVSTIKSYKELIVWQKSVLLTKEVFLLTEKFPKTEIYGITSQMRRAAVSIPSNIAEGYGRRTIKSTAQFYSIAFGSALELETQIIISKELTFTKTIYFNDTDELLLEVLKMLNKLTGNFRNLSAST